MTTISLIDTNILVYAYNESAPFHEKALEILESALNDEFNAVISDKNLFELWAIITDPKRVEKPQSIEQAHKVINFLINSNIKIIYPSSFTMLKTFELTDKYRISRQHIFDVIFVALMIENKIKTILTANDKHFKQFKEIKVINPFVDM